MKEIDTRATSILRVFFAKQRETLVGVFNFDEQKFNEICDNLDLLKSFLLRNCFIQNISLAIGELVRDYDQKKGCIDIHNNSYLKNLHALLDDTENKLSKLLKLNQIISILEKHNISKIDIILSDVMLQDLTSRYLLSLSALWEKINLIERFIKNYPINDSSYTYSIELLLLIKKFDHVDYDVLKDGAGLRYALALIFQCYEQLNIKFDEKLFEQLKENQETINSLDKLYSLRGANDVLPVKEVNGILSELSENSPVNNASKTLTSSRSSQDGIGSSASHSGDNELQSTPRHSPEKNIKQIIVDEGYNAEYNSNSHYSLAGSNNSTADNIPSVLSYKSNTSSSHSSKIALAAGLGLMVAGAVLAFFSVGALVGTGGLSSILSAAGLFASYKMIMAGILLVMGTEAWFLGEKIILHNHAACKCVSFFGKKSADDALVMSDNPPRRVPVPHLDLSRVSSNHV